MSTIASLKQLEDEEKLIRHTPRHDVPARRRLFLTPTAFQELNDRESATNMLTGRGFIEASLDKWTTGEWIHGNSRRGLFLDRLEPPPEEIWEIRVTEPNVQARLFGRFADSDTLVLTNFHTRSHLGKKGSQAWNNAMKDCLKNWDEVLGIPVFKADTINDYVTENCDDFPLK